ncbi:PP2C family serine/threonine-protein phosphatase [Parendozoicomonas haliclonae]|uniref:Protein phosphatase 2C n=1 Tax=Parendozoicomonas haliclonae TaxID=1960125 RepID=A0A1X7AGI7_9GAMM|nr:PP2C family protein-serine/threonine phosphatase [Parendozoicomonas haliclonae]SMA40069.1 Protein phosphatase 2C [Parendozoicomonas haliclonae]
MAYQMGPSSPKTTVKSLQDDLSRLPKNTENTDRAFITKAGRVVTASAYYKGEGGKPDALSFEDCQAKLRESLSSMAQKKLWDRDVKEASKQIDDSLHVNIAHIRNMVAALAKAPDQPPAPAVDPNTGMHQPPPHQNPSPKPLKRPPSPTSNEIEITVGNYQEQGLEPARRLAVDLDGWFQDHGNPQAFENLLHYLASNTPFPLVPGEVQKAAAYPGGVLAYINRERVSPKPQPRVSRTPQRAPVKTMNDLRTEAKSLFGKGHYVDAFRAYQQIIENRHFDEDPACYTKCVMNMASMLGPEGELPNFPEYPLYRLIPHLQHLIESETTDQLTKEFLRDIEQQMGQLDPTTGQPSPDRPRYPQSQHSRYQIAEQVVEQRPVNVHNTRLSRSRYSGSTMIDANHPPLSAERTQRLSERNRNVSTKDIEAMEYEVELDQGKIHQRITDAVTRAQNSARQQPDMPDFVAHPDHLIRRGDIPDFKSENLGSTSAAEAKGKRTSMEDAHTAKQFTIKLTNGQPVNIGMTAVCDGHSVNYAGHLASKHVTKSLPDALTRRLEEFNPDGLTEAGIWNAISLALVDIDRSDYLFEPGIDYTGTTANIALTIGDRLWVANVGDSRALLVMPNGSYIQASEDAKPDLDPQTQQPNHFTQEAIRRGGQLDTYGKRIHPGGGGKGNLATTHSLGDHNMGGIISARPDITSYPLDRLQGATLIQCCDGVYDVASSAQVARLFTNARHQGIRSKQEQAELLVEAAYEAGSGDNLSALVTDIDAMRW